MKNILSLILLLFSTSIFSAPYHGKVMTFRQPDGSSVEVRLFGDEYYMRAESLEGYTLLRDKNTGWIYYAELSEDGNGLVPTGIVYTGNDDDISSVTSIFSLPKHLDIPEREIIKITESKKMSLGVPSYSREKTGQSSPPVLGQVKGICLIVDFSDYPGVLPIGEFINFCNQMNYSNYGNNGSLRTYYHDISGSLLDYENVVFGYYRAPLTFEEYDQMPYAYGAKAILSQALNWVVSQGFDFSTLSVNDDNSIQAINLMYTGYPAAWAEGMWWHMGTFDSFSANGVHSHSYNCSPANDPLELSVVAHENGHMIGKWPDTYKYSGSTGPDGIGSFDLMCWYGSSNNPVPPNPFFTSDAGWKHVVDVTTFNGLVQDTANSFTCYKYRNFNDTNEFFIMENRQQSGRSVDIPDEGLTIWHIDRLGDNQSWHHQVYLEHANNDIQDHSNACFHEEFNGEFSYTSLPSSQLYNNDPSGLKVWDISGVNDIMTYKLGAGQSAPSLFLSYVSVTNDDNGNGFLEPGEQADITVNASNFGQLSSSVSIVSCQPTGSGAGYITVTNPSINLGVLGVNQTLPSVFTVNAASNTPMGEIIDIVFTLSDGVFSTWFTKQFVIGQQIIIDNGQINTCSGLFLDPGGILGNYPDYTDKTFTILPSSAGNYVRVDFEVFDLEEEANCDYDYLTIFNGPDNSFPMIGKYCGSNSPGTVSSSDPSGALTFEFHSDPAVTGEGWVGIVSCSNVIGLDNLETDEYISVCPVPSTGIINVLFPSKGKFQLTLMDIRGNIISQKSSAGSMNSLLDLTSEPNGIYLLRITGDTISANSKVILNR